MRLNDTHFIYLLSYFCLLGVYVGYTCFLYMCGCEYTYLCRNANNFGVHLLSLSTLCFESYCTEPGAHGYSWLAGQCVPEISPCRAGYNCALPCAFYMGGGDPNSGSHLSKKHSAYWAVSLAFIHSFVSSFVHSSKTRLAL